MNKKVTISVKVNTSSSVISVGKVGDMYIVKFKAAREKGKANEKLIEILSDYFELPKSAIKIIKGSLSTIKLIEIKEKSF